MSKTKEELRAFYHKLYAETGHIPYTIIRTSDKAILVLNDDFKSYSFINRNSPGSKYSFRRLFDDPRIKGGEFIVEGWAPIDVIFDNPEKYFNF